MNNLALPIPVSTHARWSVAKRETTQHRQRRPSMIHAWWSNMQRTASSPSQSWRVCSRAVVMRWSTYSARYEIAADGIGMALSITLHQNRIYLTNQLDFFKWGLSWSTACLYESTKLGFTAANELHGELELGRHSISHVHTRSWWDLYARRRVQLVQDIRLALL